MDDKTLTALSTTLALFQIQLNALMLLDKESNSRRDHSARYRRPRPPRYDLNRIHKFSLCQFDTDRDTDKRGVWCWVREKKAEANLLCSLVRPAGIEPATLSLEG